jgi:autotransporter-associated beta strand protein
LTGNSSESIDFTAYTNLMLGASSNVTYTGTITPSGGTYRLGGGGSTLTLSNANALTGTNGLVIGATNTGIVASGAVNISNSNNLSGATTINGGTPTATGVTLTLSGAAGGLASSDITVKPLGTLAFSTSTAGSAVTRAQSVTLNRGTLTVSGNATANSTDAITNALTIIDGNSILTLSPNAAKNTLLTAGSYVHNAGGTVLISGSNLGVNTLASATAGAANISFATPNLVGGAGANTTDGGIFVGAVGDTTSGGSGFGATGGLLTYDSAKGVRLLATTEYKTSITDGQTQLDNVKLTSSAGTTLATTLSTNTTINSLSIVSSGIANSAVSVTGAGTLKLNSGVIYSSVISPSASDSIISNTLDFNGKEGVILAGGNASLQLNGSLTNTGGNGLTIYGNKQVTFGGATSNTYTGTTTLNGGTLYLNKTGGAIAIAGDVVVNAGTLYQNGNNEIASTANVTVNGGSFSLAGAANSNGAYKLTINNFTMNGGSLNMGQGDGGTFTITGNATISGVGTIFRQNEFGQGGGGGTAIIGGTMSLSNGAVLNVGRSNTPSNVYDSSVTINGGLVINNTASGAYTAVTVGYGSGISENGGALVLNGDVTFNGNATNMNTALIDAPVGSGSLGVIELTGTASGARTFNVGDGAAAVDLAISAPLINGTAAGTVSGLSKTGLGTLALTGVNTYTGQTIIKQGAIVMGASGSVAASSKIIVGDTLANKAAVFDVSAVTSGYHIVSGQTLAGFGTVSGSTAQLTIDAGAFIAPGNGSVGQLSISGNNSTAALTLQGTYLWSLGALKDNSTGSAGIDFSQISLIASGANLVLGGNVTLSFLNSIADPNSTDAYWTTNHTWLIISGTTGDTNIGSTQFAGITNGTWTNGSFSTLADANGNVELAYTAVPEPATWAMLIGGFGLLIGVQSMRRRRMAA